MIKDDYVDPPRLLASQLTRFLLEAKLDLKLEPSKLVRLVKLVQLRGFHLQFGAFCSWRLATSSSS